MIKLRTALVACAAVALAVYGAVQTGMNPAQAAAGDGSYKIGIVNMQQVMDEYTKQQQGVKELEGEVKQRQATLDNLKQELEKVGDQYREDREKMTDQQRFQREEDIEVSALELQAAVKRAEIEVERRRVQLKNDLLKDILGAINGIAAEQGYHLVLEADPEFRSGVIYYATRVNMTHKVIERLNK
jgi:Skp family chaperone for outer membrane proteins